MNAFSKPNLLSSESEAEFKAMHAEIENELQPRGAIEKIYVQQFVAISWEINRYPRNKTGMIQNNFPAGLQNILKQLLHWEDYLHNVTSVDPIIQASGTYFSDPLAEKRILEVLR